MKKTVLLAVFLTLLFPVLLHAQETMKPVPPDYEWIEKVSQDPSSPYFYSTLLDRYKLGDTALTRQEYQVLYYGSFFQPTFSAFGSSPYADSTRLLLETQDTLRALDFPKLMRYETLILDEFPFSPRDLNALGYAFEKMGDSTNAMLVYYKLNRVFQTIMSTGDGRTEESGWHVISVAHEYDILNMMGFQYGGTQSLTTSICDYLTVKENQWSIEGFYFDVKKLMEAENKVFDTRFREGSKKSHKHDHHKDAEESVHLDE